MEAKQERKIWNNPPMRGKEIDPDCIIRRTKWAEVRCIGDCKICYWLK